MASIFDNIEIDGKAQLLTKADIAMRLRKLVPKAFRTLELNLYSEDDKVSTAAALGILDRCGYGPQSKLTVEEVGEDLTQLSPSELRARALAVAEQIKENAAPENAAFNDEEQTLGVH